MTLITFAADTRNTPSQPLPDKTKRRVTHLRKSQMFRAPFQVLATFEDERGRGAVLYTSQTIRGESTTKMVFFEGGGIQRPFLEKEVASSAHAVLGLEQAFHDALQELANRKKAPHPFQVGDIMVDVWGYSMQGARFYQIVSLPTPRSFEMVAIPSHYVSGNWMSGEVMPTLPEPGTIVEGAKVRMEVSMAKGHPKIVGASSISRLTKWAGQPVSVYSD